MQPQHAHSGCRGQVSLLLAKSVCGDLAPRAVHRVRLAFRFGGNPVFVHRVRTLVRKLGACQVLIVRVLIVRPSADAGLKQTRYFVTSLLEADTETILSLLAIRWGIETFFDDLKELFGSDHYQLMSATSILRFWTLACCGYVFLEEQRAQREAGGCSIGMIRRQLDKEHQSRLLEWLRQGFQNGSGATAVLKTLRSDWPHEKCKDSELPCCRIDCGRRVIAQRLMQSLFVVETKVGSQTRDGLRN